jgi:hypothetical protein
MTGPSRRPKRIPPTGGCGTTAADSIALFVDPASGRETRRGPGKDRGESAMHALPRDSAGGIGERPSHRCVT